MEPLAQDARNVIVLTVDTLRASKLRPYNPRTRVRTPALDAFAASGTVFDRAQSPENWTKPSVASILTSLYPATHNAKYDASSLPTESVWPTSKSRSLRSRWSASTARPIIK